MRILAYLIFIGFLASSCASNKVFMYSLDDDKKLGLQVHEQLMNDEKVDVLSREEYPEAYAYMDDMVKEILSSDAVVHKEDFNWDVRIIRDDVLNAFCAPGGYIFVYTGLINYLDKADDLAGVMGHEIAHADMRHTSRNLQKAYGMQLLLGTLVGENASAMHQAAAGLAGNMAQLAFSRSHERESDDMSVKYLSGTKYKCDGAASFFAKLIQEGKTSDNLPFMSTHPDPGNRVEDIRTKALEVGCSTKPSGDKGYAAFKRSLGLIK